jgi:Protein of unknown function (DUF3223)
MAQLQIRNLRFPTEAAALEHFRYMLRGYEPGDEIGDPDATELKWLLERHPRYAEKRGVGIGGFTITLGDLNSRWFGLVRLDGTVAGFSYRECIRGKKPQQPLRSALDAMRGEIAADILKKKYEWFQTHGDTEGRVQTIPLMN